MTCLAAAILPIYGQSHTRQGGLRAIGPWPTIVTTKDAKFDVLANRGQKATVLIFGLADCPITRKYAPELKRQAAEFARRAEFIFVHVDPKIELKAVTSYASEFGLPFLSGIDRHHEWVKIVGAKYVPTAALYDAKRQLRYVGRIDDLFTGLGIQQKSAKHHDLHDAIQAVLQGRAVKTNRTEAVGCDVPPLPGP